MPLRGPYFGSTGGAIQVPDYRHRGAEIEARGYSALGQGIGKALRELGEGYFKKKAEKKLAESMAENPVVMEAMYGAGEESQVPIEREQRVKDVVASIRLGGGAEKFIARMDRLKAEQQQQQRLNLAEDRAAETEARLQETAGFAKTLFQQGQQLRTENEKLAQFLTTPTRPAPVPTGFGGPQPTGSPPRESVIDKTRYRPGGPDALPSPATQGLSPRFESRGGDIERSDLSPTSKLRAMKDLQAQDILKQDRELQLGTARLTAETAGLSIKASLAKPANDLRKEFIALPSVKDFNKVYAAYKKVEKASRGDTAADDIALIFGYMKILDPGSTVREGEFATAEKAGGVDTQIVNLYNKLRKGTRLTAPQRDEFLDSAGVTAQAQFDELGGFLDFYSDVAERKGVPVADVVPKSFLKIRREGLRGPLATPPGQTAPVSVTVVMVLPSGNRLVKAEDGTFFELPPEE